MFDLVQHQRQVPAVGQQLVFREVCRLRLAECDIAPEGPLSERANRTKSVTSPGNFRILFGVPTLRQDRLVGTEILTLKPPFNVVSRVVLHVEYWTSVLIAIVEVNVTLAERRINLLYRLVHDLQAVLHRREPKPITQRSSGRCPFAEVDFYLGQLCRVAPFPQPLDRPHRRRVRRLQGRVASPPAVPTLQSGLTCGSVWTDQYVQPFQLEWCRIRSEGKQPR